MNAKQNSFQNAFQNASQLQNFAYNEIGNQTSTWLVLILARLLLLASFVFYPTERLHGLPRSPTRIASLRDCFGPKRPRNDVPE